MALTRENSGMRAINSPAHASANHATIATCGCCGSMQLAEHQVCGRFGPNKHDISIVVFPHVIAHQSLSAAVQRQCQLIFRMVVPFKRNSVGEAVD
jgi:hypothetical protein